MDGYGCDRGAKDEAGVRRERSEGQDGEKGRGGQGGQIARIKFFGMDMISVGVEE